MDSTIHKALVELVVKYDDINKRYECLLCDIKLSGQPSVLEHLKSKQHREVGARFAIKDLRKSPKSLLDLLPDSVRQAAEAGDISVMDTNKIMCHICNSSNSGVVDLNTHLLSNNHIKKRGVSSSSPIQNAKSGMVKEAVKEGIVQHLSATEFLCSLCKLNFNGEISLEQHLESKKHREECARIAIGSFKTASKSLTEKLPPAVKDAAAAGKVILTDSKAFQCAVCNVSLSGVVQLNDHLIGDDHKKRNATQSINLLNICNTPAVEQLPSKTSPDSPVHQQVIAQQPEQIAHGIPEIAKALADGIVVETDNKLDPYICKLCDKKFNNSGPLVDHLKSKKHISKTTQHDRAFSQPFTDIPPTNDTTPEKNPSLPANRYSVISDVRGQVHVFNYTFRGTNKRRTGAENDSVNLKEIFSKMGYKVFIHEDLTVEGTSETLDKIRRDPDLNEIDSFIMCFLSHGLDEYTFLANDQEEMNLQEIRRKFTNRKCPYLRGKPKIFFVNYCRGDQIQKRDIEFDSMDVPDDMVTIHASTEGVMARRDRESGTIFVTALCEVLKSHSREMELRNIYHELEAKMKERKGTKPMWEDYGFKPFFFNPV